MIDPEGEFNRALGKKIKELRGRGTQRNLAEAVGLPRTSLVLIEKGEQAVRAYTLVKLAEVLGATVDELVQLIPRSAPPPPSTAPLRVQEWVTRMSTSPTIEGVADAENQTKPNPNSGGSSSRDGGGSAAPSARRSDRRNTRNPASPKTPRRRR